MITKTFGGIIDGIDGSIITIEADVSKGMPYFNIIGLADISVKESKDRIKTAITNSQMEFPEARITVNLAPASLKKEGAALDLGTAAAILNSAELIQFQNIEKIFFIGELLLSGEIKFVPGALPLVLSAEKNGFEYAVIPDDNKFEAGVLKNIKIIPVKSLYQMIQYLNGNLEILPFKSPDNYRSEEHTSELQSR